MHQDTTKIQFFYSNKQSFYFSTCYYREISQINVWLCSINLLMPHNVGNSSRTDSRLVRLPPHYTFFSNDTRFTTPQVLGMCISLLRKWSFEFRSPWAHECMSPAASVAESSSGLWARLGCCATPLLHGRSLTGGNRSNGSTHHTVARKIARARGLRSSLESSCERIATCDSLTLNRAVEDWPSNTDVSILLPSHRLRALQTPVSPRPRTA